MNKASDNASKATSAARFWVLMQGGRNWIVESNDRPSTEAPKGDRRIEIVGAYDTRENAERKLSRLSANSAVSL